MFKVIQGTNERYSIDENGNVINNETKKSLKSYINNKGYKYIDLRIDGKTKKFLIHRLVALTFIENKNKDYKIVNHIDNNPLNCNVNNLEWCDYSYNNKYGYDKGNRVLTPNQIKARRKPSTHLYKKVYQYDKDWNFIAEYNSLTEAQNATGATKANIGSCCSNRYGAKTAKGFRWSYHKK